MSELFHPGLYYEEQTAAPVRAFRTGVPAFLADLPAVRDTPVPISRFSQFLGLAGVGSPFLKAAVSGFFENGGQLCYLVTSSLPNAFAAIDATGADLVCWPGLMEHPENALAQQQDILHYCDRGGERMFILDTLPASAVVDDVAGGTLQAAVKQWQVLHGINAALYFPWVRVRSGPPGRLISVPPCGHIAGVYARIDREIGVFAAPANVELEGVQDLDVVLTDATGDQGNPHNVVNCMRLFPGRGIRVWGARTISGQANWRYVSVRRLFLTLHRWISTMMADVVLEPNDRILWARIRRELNNYLESLFRAGAMKGATPSDAFYVRCDATTNTVADRDAGRVNVEVGLAPAVPAEFIVVRLVFGAPPEKQEKEKEQ